MNLNASIELFAIGGPGSGCHGPNCGRPRTLYHLTDKKNLADILKHGIRTEKTGARALNKGWDRTKNAVYAFEDIKHLAAVKWSLENELNPSNTPGSLGKKQVVVAFRSSGRVRVDPEFNDFDTEDGKPVSARIHSGPVPASNVIGYHDVDKEGNLSPLRSKK